MFVGRLAGMVPCNGFLSRILSADQIFVDFPIFVDISVL